MSAPGAFHLGRLGRVATVLAAAALLAAAGVAGRGGEDAAATPARAVMEPTQWMLIAGTLDGRVPASVLLGGGAAAPLLDAALAEEGWSREAFDLAAVEALALAQAVRLEETLASSDPIELPEDLGRTHLIPTPQRLDDASWDAGQLALALIEARAAEAMENER